MLIFYQNGKIFLTLGYSSATSNLGIVALGLVQFQGHFFFYKLVLGRDIHQMRPFFQRN